MQPVQLPAARAVVEHATFAIRVAVTGYIRA